MRQEMKAATESLLIKLAGRLCVAANDVRFRAFDVRSLAERRRCRPLPCTFRVVIIGRLSMLRLMPPLGLLRGRRPRFSSVRQKEK